MRIVIKPLGAAFLMVSISLLALLAFTGGKRTASVAPPPTSAQGGASSALKQAPATNLLTQEPYTLSKVVAPIATLRMVPAEGKPGGYTEAARVTLTAIPARRWDAQLKQRMGMPVRAGQALTARFWGRSETRNPITVVFEKDGPPYTRTLNQIVTLTPEWKEYTFSFTTAAYPAAGAALKLHLGMQPGTMDICGLRLHEE